jgi:hypothetical protein
MIRILQGARHTNASRQRGGRFLKSMVSSSSSSNKKFGVVGGALARHSSQQRGLGCSVPFSTTSSKDESSSSSSLLSSSIEWRKHQLDQLEKKFARSPESTTTITKTTTTTTATPTMIPINDDDELQPTWKQMESRVTKRRSRTMAETGGKTGRSNIKKTDEEMWLQGGLYDQSPPPKEEQPEK